MNTSGKLRAISIILLAFLFAHAASAASKVKVPPFERIQLPNGTVLLLTERHDVPLIAFEAVMRGGASTDPERESGMASLLAGLLDKGAGQRDALAFANTLASVGGVISATAGTESIVVSGSFLAKDQKLMVELLADVLQRPRLEPEQFANIRSRQIEFIRSAKDSELDSLTPVYGKALLFTNHPYAKPTMGSEAGLAAIEHADLKRFYESQFGADRLIVSVAGDFKNAAMKQLLTQAFANWRKAPAQLTPAPAPIRQTGRRVLLVDAPESVQSYFWAGNVGVARTFSQRAALDVVNTLFGGRFTSMLNSELRIKSGLSYGARSRFERLTQPGTWQMSSYTRTETTIEAIDLALSVLDRLHDEPIDPTMLSSGKSYVQGQFPLGLETAEDWAGTLADLEFYRLDRSYIDQYADALGAVTDEDAKRIIAEVYPTSQNVTLVVIGQASVIREGLRKFGPITEMKLSDAVFVPARVE